MEEREITIYDVIAKKKEITKRADTKLIMKAYHLAEEKHKGQKRGSVSRKLSISSRFFSFVEYRLL